MEGPSLFLASEQLQPFVGKTVLEVSGNTKFGKERLPGQKVVSIFSFTKLLIFQFDTFAVRVHFLLFGSFEAMVGKKRVTGDYIRTYAPRLVLKFRNGEIRMFGCSVKFIETKEAIRDFDFTTDIMSPAWDEKAALSKVRKQQNEEVADVLLDQAIFGGVGNIIKNEVLFLKLIHPKTPIKNLALPKLKALIQETHAFSQNFYKWRKKFELKKHYQIYRKGICPICGGKVTREKTGKRKRMSFYCPLDQPLR